jgi:hypothetical protein
MRSCESSRSGSAYIAEGLRFRPTISRHCNHSCQPSGVVATAWNPETKVIEVMVKLIKPVNTREQVGLHILCAIDAR